MANGVLAVTALFAGLALAGPASAIQRTIIISDSLASNADTLVVRKGARWAGRIANWRFGDYAVVSSHTNWSRTDFRRNLLNTQAEASTKDKWSFVLSNGAGDSAWVSAAHHIMVQALQGLQLGHGFFLGRGQELRESENFAAFITINRDTTDTWVLYLGERPPDSTNRNDAMLTNGDRRVTLYGANSGNRSRIPALGYEFNEGGRPIGAVQFFGGPFGVTQLAWIDRTLDQQMQLVLAAAMTAALNLNSP